MKMPLCLVPCPALIVIFVPLEAPQSLLPIEHVCFTTNCDLKHGCQASQEPVERQTAPLEVPCWLMKSLPSLAHRLHPATTPSLRWLLTCPSEGCEQSAPAHERPRSTALPGVGVILGDVSFVAGGRESMHSCHHPKPMSGPPLTLAWIYLLLQRWPFEPAPDKSSILVLITSHSARM